MANFTSFMNMFLSYLLVFVIFATVIVGASFLGIYLRKRKNKKEELENITKSSEV